MVSALATLTAFDAPAKAILPNRYARWSTSLPRIPVGAPYWRAFIEDIKATRLITKTIEKNNVRGLTVAGAA